VALFAVHAYHCYSLAISTHHSVSFVTCSVQQGVLGASFFLAYTVFSVLAQSYTISSIAIGDHRVLHSGRVRVFHSSQRIVQTVNGIATHTRGGDIIYPSLRTCYWLFLV